MATSRLQTRQKANFGLPQFELVTKSPKTGCSDNIRRCHRLRLLYFFGFDRSKRLSTLSTSSSKPTTRRPVQAEPRRIVYKGNFNISTKAARQTQQAGTGPSRRHIQGSKIAKRLPSVKYSFTVLENRKFFEIFSLKKLHTKKMDRVAR